MIKDKHINFNFLSPAQTACKVTIDIILITKYETRYVCVPQKMVNRNVSCKKKKILPSLNLLHLKSYKYQIVT